MKWTYGRWRAAVRVPFGAREVADRGVEVRAGDVIARGDVYRATRRVDAARVLSCRPEGVTALLRVRVGDDVAADTVIARAGRRFPRAIVAKEDGRLVHVGADGALFVGSVRREWQLAAPLDGVVLRADEHHVEIEGEAWGLEGVAAFGPSRAGILTVGVEAPDAELGATRLDVRLDGAVLVGGRRASGEALSRGHAVGVHAIVTAAVSFRSLRAVYGPAASAFGLATDEDVPTLLVLAGFGNSPFPEGLFARLASLAGSRASVDAHGARLYVNAPPHASEALEVPPPALAPDLSGFRP